MLRHLTGARRVQALQTVSFPLSIDVYLLENFANHEAEGVQECRYILDIRNNGGGLFPAGVEVARMLMKEGDIVLIADSQGVRDSYSANGIPVETNAPLSVLVNRGTASASEVGH